MKQWHWLSIMIIIFFSGWGLAIEAPVIGRSLMFLALIVISLLIFYFIKNNIDKKT
jgi:hypothetical protein